MNKRELQWILGIDGVEGFIEDLERPAVSFPDMPLPYVHYSDPYWNEARLIYGQQCKTDECNYSDRLWEWDWEKAERAAATCKGEGMTSNTARWSERWLSAYHNRPVILHYIMAGCNWATGYTYYVYGYSYAQK